MTNTKRTDRSICVHIILWAKADNNGNSRRVSLLFHPADGLIESRDHRCGGDWPSNQRLRDWWPREVAKIGPVPVREYKGWLEAGALGRMWPAHH
jgi:hypothetical protein